MNSSDEMGIYAPFLAASYAEDVITTEITQPFVRDTFTAGRVDGAGARGSFAGLPLLLHECLGACMLVRRLLRLFVLPCRVV